MAVCSCPRAFCEFLQEGSGVDTENETFAFSTLIDFRQRRRLSIMGRVVTPIIKIFFFHFTTSFSAENFSFTTNLVSSAEVDITAQNAIQPRNQYFLDYTRGHHTYNTSQGSPGISNDGDTVTRMFASLSNNTIIEMLDAVKVQNTSQNTRKIDGLSHFNLEFRNCINRRVRYHVTDSKTTVHWSFNPTGYYSILSSDPWFCDLELSVPPGMVAFVQIVKVINNIDLDKITLLDDANVTLFTGLPGKLPSPFVTYSHLVTFHLTVANTQFVRRSDFIINMNITKLPETSRPQLEITFNSSKSGKVEMKNWKFQETTIPFVKTSLHLRAPADHIVVVHFILHHRHCLDENTRHDVTFRTDNNTVTYQLCKSPTNLCNALAFYSGWVLIEVISYEMSSETDFTITFDFQHISQPPAELSGDRWNCSVTDWSEMWQDSPCIFVFDCYDKEAEGGCWQGDGKFKQGVFQVDGRCIGVSQTDQQSTWYLESEWCQKRGGKLVSLSTSNFRDRLLALLPRINLLTRSAIGLTTMSRDLSPMYKQSLQWLDKTVAHTSKTKLRTGLHFCFFLYVSGTQFGFSNILFKESCNVTYRFTSHLCQLSEAPGQQRDVQLPVIFTNETHDRLSKAAYVRCPANHFTHVFLACDDVSSCWSNNYGAKTSCSAPLTPLPPSFRCGGAENVPYTLVCDHRSDCKDRSDEDFCDFAPCDGPLAVLCSGRKCVDYRMVCNDKADCDDYADEYLCHISSLQENMFSFEDLISTSTRLDFREGRLMLTDYNMSEMSTFSCPVSHFMCASLPQVCLPVFLRCNGLYDCPDHEDEAECDRYTCPGFYRCRQSQVCVHESHVCDGEYHCPQRDDEILCNQTCPQSCFCYGLAFICSDIFSAADYSNLRYLDASGTSMTLADMRNNTFLVHLSLVRCNLTKLHEVVLPNLRILDLSYNKLTEISGRFFAGLKNIEFLKISNNPLTSFYLHNFTYTSSLKIFDMSHVRISEFDFAIISFFPTLTTLNLSGSEITYVTGQGFPRLINLQVLDLRQCPLTHFPKRIFQGLDRLESVFADNYKLCCPATLPKGFNVLNCQAPSDEVSSCDDLLRSNLYRVALATFASLSLLGNVGTLVYRLIFHKTTGNVGYDVFVSNLCVADLLMGVYLLIIGIADHRYRGFYVWEDVGWRNSDLCKVTGFVCFLSMEVSVLMIFLITSDRFLVLRFPFSWFHFRKRSAQLTCGVVWLAGLVLAVTPCLPMTSHWQFYSQTSICIPLPTSRVEFPGRKYSFIVIVVFNFICFLLIFIGQVLIYWSIRSSSMSVSNTSKAVNDITIARRLVTVVMSDFLCWFPVGLTGILASYDFPVAGEVNVAMAIFILHANSALNPFLYTLNIYLERRRRAREEERQKRIICQIKVKKIVEKVDM